MPDTSSISSVFRGVRENAELPCCILAVSVMMSINTAIIVGILVHFSLPLVLLCGISAAIVSFFIYCKIFAYLTRSEEPIPNFIEQIEINDDVNGDNDGDVNDQLFDCDFTGQKNINLSTLPKNVVLHFNKDSSFAGFNVPANCTIAKVVFEGSISSNFIKSCGNMKIKCFQFSNMSFNEINGFLDQSGVNVGNINAIYDSITDINMFSISGKISNVSVVGNSTFFTEEKTATINDICVKKNQITIRKNLSVSLPNAILEDEGYAINGFVDYVSGTRERSYTSNLLISGIDCSKIRAKISFFNSITVESATSLSPEKFVGPADRICKSLHICSSKFTDNYITLDDSVEFFIEEPEGLQDVTVCCLGKNVNLHICGVNLQDNPNFDIKMAKKSINFPNIILENATIDLGTLSRSPMNREDSLFQINSIKNFDDNADFIVPSGMRCFALGPGIWKRHMLAGGKGSKLRLIGNFCEEPEDAFLAQLAVDELWIQYCLCQGALTELPEKIGKLCLYRSLLPGEFSLKTCPNTVYFCECTGKIERQALKTPSIGVLGENTRVIVERMKYAVDLKKLKCKELFLRQTSVIVENLPEAKIPIEFSNITSWKNSTRNNQCEQIIIKDKTISKLDLSYVEEEIFFSNCTFDKDPKSSKKNCKKKIQFSNCKEKGSNSPI